MSFYRWCMRSGAAILFALAFLQLVIGLAYFVQIVIANGSPMGDGRYSIAQGDPPFQFLVMLQMLTRVLVAAAWPFAGALLINRVDRWLALKERAEAAE
jgi:hypothetical protein